MGPAFGFCPGKATWYPEAQRLFRLLILAAETGTPLFSGGLVEQPDWATEILSWFVPDYLDKQFNKRANQIFGSDKGKAKEPTKPKGK